MEKVVGFIITMVIVAGMLLLFAFPTMWTWNSVMPEVFGLPVLKYWQMVSLQVLVALMLPNATTKITDAINK
jgi:hypothetical protein